MITFYRENIILFMDKPLHGTRQLKCVRFYNRFAIRNERVFAYVSVWTCYQEYIDSKTRKNRDIFLNCCKFANSTKKWPNTIPWKDHSPLYISMLRIAQLILSKRCESAQVLRRRVCSAGSTMRQTERRRGTRW